MNAIRNGSKTKKKEEVGARKVDDAFGLGRFKCIR